MSDVFSSEACFKASNVRESMRVCPHIIQRGLTALTGKALSGEKPWVKTPGYHLVTAVGVLILGVGCSAFASHCLLSPMWERQIPQVMQWPLVLAGLLLGWGLTVSGARKLQVMIVHQAAHDNLFRIPWLDTWIGVVLSIILMIGSFASYKLAHRRNHHARLMTADDPTLRFLEDLVGLRPGMPKAQCWRQLSRALWSPTFHGRFLWSRLRSHFHEATPDHVLATAAFMLFLLGMVSMTETWGIFLFVWVLPLSVFYQMSACLRLCVEHRLPPTEYDGPNDRETYASLTQGVFLGEPVPETRHWWPWVRWWGRMLSIHLAARVLVMVGDTPCHDGHHRAPNGPDWIDYARARQRDIDAGCPGWPSYTEVWGLHNAIDAVFASFSEAGVEANALEENVP